MLSLKKPDLSRLQFVDSTDDVEFAACDLFPDFRRSLEMYHGGADVRFDALMNLLRSGK